MEEREEVDSRRAALMNLLDGECRWESIRARVDYWIAVLLMWVALISSFVAGLGGLSGKFSPAVTGAIALVPATIALIATTLKFEAKSDWHYKKLYSLSAFRERLKFEMPLELTIEHLSAISRERRELIVELNKEWNKNLALDFSHLKGRKIP